MADETLTEPVDHGNSALAAVEALLAQRALEFYEPYPKQMAFHEAGKSFAERLLMAGNQLGKALKNNTLVLTPTGWREIGDLAVGDCVIAGDGTPTDVVGVYPQGRRPLYKLTFDRGETVYADGAHLWKFRHPKDRPGRSKTFGQWSVANTEALLAIDGPTPRSSRRCTLPVVSPVQFPTKGVPLDPYFVGLMLGDGCLRKRVMFTSKDEEIIRWLRDYAALFGLRVRADDERHYTITSPSHRQKDFQNPLIAIFQSLGMYGRLAYEKAVPHEYLWNSIEVRLGVLQGLLDTDGTIGTDGTIDFNTTSPQLADDVRFLVQSLGGTVGRWQSPRRPNTYTYKGTVKQGRPSWQMGIRLQHLVPFQLTRKIARRKRSRWAQSTRNERVLISIEPTAPADATCIAVAHSSHTYVVEHFIVTHNTVAASRETAYHATGKYPDWWPGYKFTKRTVGWTGSPTGQTSRDTVQRLLLGRPGEWGTGAIPKADIAEIKRAAGSVPDQIESIIVRCVHGGQSTITLKSFDQGRTRWQGESIDYVWFDEEPPLDIYSEGRTRTQAAKPHGVFVYMTFTPMLGMSSVVTRFLNEKPAGTSVTGMTIYDAGHYTPAEREAIIAGYPVHERDARAKGIPIMGSGRVFTIPEETLRIEPIAIPPHWARGCGMDFGWDHPTANVWGAWDKDEDVFYIYAVHRQRETTPVVQAAAIKSRGPWIPVFWPHDGLQHDKGSGVQIAQQYKAQGVNMWKERSTHAPTGGKPEGSGGFSVEAGIVELIDRMQTGRLKVFRTCGEWFDEYRMFHRKDGLIVKEGDDLMSATRILVMMRRFMKVAPLPQRATAPKFVVTDPSMGVLG